MKEVMQLNPVWPDLVSGAAILIMLGALLWMEVRRKSPRKGLRVLCAIVMTAAIAGALLRPGVIKETSGQMVLLTPGYDVRRIDSLVAATPGVKIYHTDGTEPYERSVEASPNALGVIGPGLSLIAGYGLNASERDAIGDAAFAFAPAPLPDGVVQLDWDDDAVVGRPMTIRGILNNLEKPRTLHIEGPGGVEDSVTCAAGVRPFSLEINPKETGSFRYTLYLDGDTVGHIPIIARDRLQLDVLFLLGYPTFESRQLKVLLEKQHRLLLRYAYSLDKFRFEYVNRDAQSLYTLSESALADFDLVIIDTDALNDLPASEFERLQRAVDAGLGVIMLFNESPAGHRRTKALLDVGWRSNPKDTAHIRMPAGKAVIPVVPLQAEGERELVPVLKAGKRTISGYTFHGLGKVGFHLAQQTYALALKGDALHYTELWIPLLEKVSRTQPRDRRIVMDAPFPHYADEPVAFHVLTSGGAPKVTHNEVTLPVREDHQIDNLWYGKFWAGQHGWHSLALDGDSAARNNFYVSKQNEWRSLALAHRIAATRRLSVDKHVDTTTARAFTPLPLWIFYAMFLLSGGVLWLMPKL